MVGGSGLSISRFSRYSMIMSGSEKAQYQGRLTTPCFGCLDGGFLCLLFGLLRILHCQALAQTLE